MILKLTAKTSVDDLIIDFIQVTTKQGESLSMNWEASYITRDSKGFSARYIAVCFGEEYANGKLESLRDMTIDVIGLYSESEKKLDIEVTEMIFYDNEKNLTLENVYKSDDNEAYTEFKDTLEKFVREQVGQEYKNELRAFTENEDDSGLYDIAYDMKWSIFSNEFNPFDLEERTFESFGRMYDEWYDGFIESDILPILKRIAYETKEGENG